MELSVGVRGVRAPLGVLAVECNPPPGEKSEYAFGDNQDSTIHYDTDQ